MYADAKFVKVENNRCVTKKEDFMFCFELQRGVLLSLKDIGLLNEIQFRSAQTRLKEGTSNADD